MSRWGAEAVEVAGVAGMGAEVAGVVATVEEDLAVGAAVVVTSVAAAAVHSAAGAPAVEVLAVIPWVERQVERFAVTRVAVPSVVELSEALAREGWLLVAHPAGTWEQPVLCARGAQEGCGLRCHPDREADHSSPITVAWEETSVVAGPVQGIRSPDGMAAAWVAQGWGAARGTRLPRDIRRAFRETGAAAAW